MTQRHGLDQARRHIDAAIAAIAAMPEPTERFAAADELLRELQTQRTNELAAVKGTAAQQVRDTGLTWDQAAERLGLNNGQRAQQIASRAPTGAQRRRAARST